MGDALDFQHGALAGDRYRIIISTDIGGSDPDDFQSMIHFLLYSDLFDVEGIISSPWGEGRKEHILQAIGVYEKDYPKLKQRSTLFPSPDYLRSISKQGAIDIAPYKGFQTSTEGSHWIVKCAKKDDPRPLYILAWALPEDIAQALHDAPEILPKLRVIFIGGPNKKWGVNAFDYMERNFPDLWIIENNSTYRGFFNGGRQDGDLGNFAFYENHIQDHGFLGEYFGRFRGGDIKMGDTPTLTYLFYGDPENPETDSWGGKFQRVKHRPKFIFNRHTGADDQIEVFSVAEWTFKGPDREPASDASLFQMKIDGQYYKGYSIGGGEYGIRLCPKSVGLWSYVIESPLQFLNGKTGLYSSVGEGELGRRSHETAHKNWWTDLFDPAYKEGVHSGAKTQNQWRENILRHWQERLDWIR
ncbi:MAG: DUF1593 domain-containing protein [Candidatus Omnitrophica bacterium]|nr:DUF1593 domain-containing protein [Candidatus Omnitrophota bacterium]